MKTKKIRQVYEKPVVLHQTLSMESCMMAGSLTENQLKTTNVTVRDYMDAQDGFNDAGESFNSIGF